METREVNDLQIKFDKKRKRLFWYPVIELILPCLIIIPISILFIWQAIFKETSISDIVFIFSIISMLTIVFGSLTIGAIFRLNKMRHEKPAFILDKNGITDLSKPFLPFGFVAWNEIESIESIPPGSKESLILIKLKDYKLFINKKPILLRLALLFNKSMYGTCIKIPTLLLEGHFQQVVDVAKNTWLAQRKNRPSPEKQLSDNEEINRSEVNNLQIKFDKKRKLVFWFPAGIIFSLIIALLFFATKSIYILLIILIHFPLLLATIFVIIKMIRNQPAFYLDKHGIIDCSKPFYPFGFLAWNEIESIIGVRSGETGGGKILITLKNRKIFTGKKPFIFKITTYINKIFFNAHITIQTIFLEGHFQPVVDKFKEFYEKNKSK